MLKIISSFHGVHSIFYGLLRAFNAWHAGERRPRPTPAGERTQFNEKMPWQDIVGLVASGLCVPLNQPLKFLCKVNHPISIRLGDGKMEMAKVGEIVEVRNDVDIWPRIAVLDLIPVTSGVWSPSRLSPRGRLQEAGGEKKKSDFIKLPDMTVDDISEPKSAKEAKVWADYVKKRKP